MNRNRLLIGLAVALVLALILSSVVYRALQKSATATTQTIPMTKVVVAAEPLPIGSRLDNSKVKTISWPKGQAMDGMFTDVSDVANRAVITPVAENEPILASKLAAVDSGAGLSATIPEGMRAVSVPVNDVVGVAGFVTPGTMVDVLVTGNTAGNGAGVTTSITRTILENIRVLAAGQKMDQDREGKPQTVPVITLLVTPEQAGKLTMASTEGKIQLALRNTIDTKTTNPAPVLQSTLFASTAPEPVATTQIRHAAAPKKEVPPPYTIEVITGGKREMKNFPNP
jgi:pilus assembly protein CpaB